MAWHVLCSFDYGNIVLSKSCLSIPHGNRVGTFYLIKSCPRGAVL